MTEAADSRTEHNVIAVVDFGGQYAHLIATKVRRQGVLAEIRQPDDPLEAFAPYRGIIISGSPSLASSGEDSDYTKAIYDLDVPILGLCFGHQEIAQHYGGDVVHGGRQWERPLPELGAVGLRATEGGQGFRVHDVPALAPRRATTRARLAPAADDDRLRAGEPLVRRCAP